MDHSGKASVPPQQKHGISKDFEEILVCETLEEAEEAFVGAKERLLQVNGWQEMSKTIKSQFQVVDEEGRELHRKAHKDDYIRIDIPAPGSKAGEGSDWVRVDALEYDDYPDDNRELIAMRLRPADNPANRDSSIAHFFSEASSSTFIIERTDKVITAKYHGRNEVPNTGTEALGDKMRNVVVAVGAMLGFSDVQWKGLLKGFLDVLEGTE